MPMLFKKKQQTTTPSSDEVIQVAESIVARADTVIAWLESVLREEAKRDEGGRQKRE